MTVWPAIISALCALLGTLAGFCATVRRQAADMAQIRSRLDCLTELGEEIRREQRRMAELSVEMVWPGRRKRWRRRIGGWTAS